MARIREEAVDWSEIYKNAQTNIWERSPHQFSRLAVGLTTPGLALDLGCGEGYDALYFAEQGYETTAVDISQTALNGLSDTVQDKSLHIETRQDDVITYEVAEQQMIIASFGVLHFLGGDYAEKIKHYKEQTMDGGVHALYVFGDSGGFHDIAQHKFWFPSIDSLRTLYRDWYVHRLETNNAEMLIQGDNGETLHNQLIKLLAQKK